MHSFRIHTFAIFTLLLLSNTACMQKNQTTPESGQKIMTTNPSEQVAILTPSKAHIISNVPFKHNPSVRSGTMRFLRTGETVTIVGQSNSNWFKIVDENQTTGYVRSDPHFIKVIPNNLNLD